MPTFAIGMDAHAAEFHAEGMLHFPRGPWETGAPSAFALLQAADSGVTVMVIPPSVCSALRERRWFFLALWAPLLLPASVLLPLSSPAAWPLLLHLFILRFRCSSSFEKAPLLLYFLFPLSIRCNSGFSWIFILFDALGGGAHFVFSRGWSYAECRERRHAPDFLDPDDGLGGSITSSRTYRPAFRQLAWFEKGSSLACTG